MRVEHFVRLRKEYRDMLKYLVQDVKGNVIYVGPLYTYPEKGGYKKAAWKMAGASTLMFLCCFVGGFMNFKAMNTRWMVAPYIPEVLCTAMCMWAAFRTVFYKEPLKFHEYAASWEVLPARSAYSGVSAIAGFISILIYTIKYGVGDSMINTLTYLGLRLAVAGIAFAMLRRLSKLEFDMTGSVDKSKVDLSEEDAMAEEVDEFEEKIRKMTAPKKDPRR